MLDRRKAPLLWTLALLNAFFIQGPAHAAMTVEKLPPDDPYAPGKTRAFPSAILLLATQESQVSASDFEDDDYFWSRTKAVQTQLVAQGQRLVIAERILRDPVSVLDLLEKLAIERQQLGNPLSARDYLDAVFYIRKTLVELGDRRPLREFIRGFFVHLEAAKATHLGPNELLQIFRSDFYHESLRREYTLSEWNGVYPEANQDSDKPIIHIGAFYGFTLVLSAMNPALTAADLLRVFTEPTEKWSLRALLKSQVNPHQEIRDPTDFYVVIKAPGEHNSTRITLSLDQSKLIGLVPRVLSELVQKHASLKQIHQFALFLEEGRSALSEFTEIQSYLGYTQSFHNDLQKLIFERQQNALKSRRDPEAYTRFLAMVHSLGSTPLAQIQEYLPLEMTPQQRLSIIKSLGQMLARFDPEKHPLREVKAYCDAIQCNAAEFVEVVQQIKKAHPKYEQHRTPTFERVGASFVKTMEDYITIGGLRWDQPPSIEESRRWIENGLPTVKTAYDLAILISLTPGGASVAEEFTSHFRTFPPDAKALGIWKGILPKVTEPHSMAVMAFLSKARDLTHAEDYTILVELSTKAPMTEPRFQVSQKIQQTLSHYFELRPSLQQIRRIILSLDPKQDQSLVVMIQRHTLELLQSLPEQEHLNGPLNLESPQTAADYVDFIRDLLRGHPELDPDFETLIQDTFATFFKLNPNLETTNQLIAAGLPSPLREKLRLLALDRIHFEVELRALSLPLWFWRSPTLKSAIKRVQKRIQENCAAKLIPNKNDN